MVCSPACWRASFLLTVALAWLPWGAEGATFHAANRQGSSRTRSDPSKVPTFQARLIPPRRIGGPAEAEVVVTNDHMDPLRVSFRWEVVDFFQERLAGGQEDFLLAPGQQIRTATFPTRGRRLIRLTVYFPDGKGQPCEITRFMELEGVQGVRNCLRLPRDRGWERLVVPLGQQPSYPPAGTWEAVGTADGPPESQWAWFRQWIRTPHWLRGERYRLDFLRVNFRCRVYLNGREVGHHEVGHTPFSLDITEAFRPGAENLLEVLVGSIETTKRDPQWNPNIPGRYYQNDYLVPPAFNFQNWGLLEDVWLVAHASVHLEEVFVQPSVRRQELAGEVTLHNDGATPATFILRGQVLDRGQPAFTLPSRRVHLQAGERRTVRWAARWAHPRLWWPWDPYLYELRTQLVNGKPLDEVRTRFGFREIRIEGIFYTLNGRRMKLRTSTAGADWGALHHREGVRQWFVERRGRFGPYHYVRTHLFPVEQGFLEVTDELGVLVKPECALWSTVFNPLDDPRFWNNAALHIASFIRSRRNHPSLIAWSLENEVLIASNLCPHLYASNIRHLQELGRLARKIDPTRPIEFEGDADLDGSWNTYNLHYPRWWSRWSHYPEDAYWLGQTADQPCDQSWPPRIRWRRDKPVILGELGPFGTEITRPHDLSLVLGEAAYPGDISYDSSHLRAADDAMFALMIEGYRDSEVGLICPELGGSGGPKLERSLLPVRFFVREWDRRFFGGDEVQRHVNIHHDLLADGELTFSWRLEIGNGPGETGAHGGLRFQAGPGELHRTTISFRLPQVEKPKGAKLILKLYRNSRLTFSEMQSYEVVPQEPLALPPEVKIGVWRTGGPAARLFDRLGIPYRGLCTIEKGTQEAFLEELSGVVIDRDYLALGRANYPSMESTLSRFVARGGKVLCLEQDRPTDWPGGASLLPSGRVTSYAWRRAPDHPALAGITDEELRFWRGDHAVARNDFLKPSRGNFLPLIDAGGHGGLLWTPLVEIPHGKGSYLLSQLCLTEKATTDPTARRLLGNLLTYTAQPVYRQVGPALLHSAGLALLQALQEMGVRFQRFSESPASLARLESRPTVLVDASVPSNDLRPLVDYAQRGGTILVKGLTPENAAAWSRALGVSLRLQPIATGRLLKVGPDPLLAGISHTELCTSFGYHVRNVEGPPLARFAVAAEPSSTMLRPPLDPPALAVFPIGSGKVVFDQVLWDAPPTGHPEVSDREVREKARRYGSILLTNLGVEMGW